MFTQSSKVSKVIQPTAKHSLAYRLKLRVDLAFAVAALKLWNSQAVFITIAPTLHDFKVKLKTCLFYLTFNHS